METQSTGRLFNFSIGNTGLWTCALRARETKREDALFKDEYAEMFGGKEANAFLQRVEESVKESKNKVFMKQGGTFVAIRHKFFDDFLISKVKEQKGTPKQVIIGAAGLDSRAFRIEWPENTNLFELDQEEILKYKESKVKEFDLTPKCNRIPIGVDFREDSWKDFLKLKGFKSDQPSTWVFEGLLPYLTEDNVHFLLRNLAKIVHKDTWICFDVPSKIDKQLNKELLEHLEEENSPLKFFMPDPDSLLKSCGFEQVKIVLPGDPEANYGRWFTEEKGGWESFFVVAKKRDEPPSLEA